jgi:hypothetical protein
VVQPLRTAGALMPASPGPARDPFLAVWFALGLMFAVFVGTAAGILGWLNGEKTAAAVLTGSGAFAGTITLVVLVIKLFRC